MSTAERYPVVIVGGGPAGLATSAELRRRRIDHVVLERGDAAGHTWMHLYDSLTLHTGKHLSSLPGMSFDRRVPLFPARKDFVAYLHRYVEVMELPIETGRIVTAVERNGDSWLVRTPKGDIEANAVVMATGIVAGPRVPVIAGRDRYRGRITHSVEYRRPADYVGRRVLVVGVGNSGGEIASELARAGAHVTVSVRSGANVVPLQIAGIPIQYLSFLMRSLPAGARRSIAGVVGRITEVRRGKPVLPKPAHGPLDSIPLIGFHLVDEIRAGKVQVRGALASLTETGARFATGVEEPFDEIILATGFTPALSPLGTLVRVDEKGFALRTDRVTSADQPNLYFVGHTYDATGGLYNIGRDAKLAAARIASGAGARQSA
ncbi:MAG TPA: NAD(P)/FAD-dependent oxidoreductase [Gemmatimonadaceae bacterium]|nr:NAD(P)/FAD-dependent oxidoreductase [Gemmatimonadaceae bacterium]